jgi:hypothetical protein
MDQGTGRPRRYVVEQKNINFISLLVPQQHPFAEFQPH